jgi:hypothetical protein
VHLNRFYKKLETPLTDYPHTKILFNMINKCLTIAAVLLTILLMLQQISCKKEPLKCIPEDCLGMLHCYDNKCGCPENQIIVAGGLCVLPESFAYIALSDAGGCIPENFFFYFVHNPNSINSTTPGEFISSDLTYNAPEYNRSGGPQTSYTKASFPPEGIEGDQFRLYLPFKAYPSALSSGSCDMYIKGTFVHPDTISTTLTFLSCKPANMPEANNQYQVKFVRIKRP